MSALLELLETHGLRLALGSTICLAVGAGVSLASRSPLRIQRVGELATLLALLWIGVAFLPLPQAAAPRGTSTNTPATPVASPIPEAPTAPTIRGVEPLELELAAAPPTSLHAHHSESDDRVASTWLAGLFLLGAALRSAWLLLGVLCLAAFRRRTAPAPAAVRELAAELSPALRPEQIRITTGSARPFCAPFPRPVIMLPASLCEAGNEDVLRAVLLHELAHVERRDLAGEALFAAASPLLYWNPLFWLLHRRARQSAELLADDVATRGMDKPRYVRALVRLAESTVASGAAGIGALSAIELENDFYRRIQMLMTRETKLETGSPRSQTTLCHGLAVALLAGLGFTLGMPSPAASASAMRPVQAPTEKAEARRYVLKFGFEDQQALGVLVTEAVRQGHAVEILDVQKPEKAGEDWRGELAIESVNPSFPQEATALFSSVDAAEVYALKTKAPSAPVKPKPQGPVVSMTASDTDFRDLVEELASLAKANIILAPEVQGSLTVAFAETPWRAALDASAGALGYAVEEHEGGILVIRAAR